MHAMSIGSFIIMGARDSRRERWPPWPTGARGGRSWNTSAGSQLRERCRRRLRQEKKWSELDPTEAVLCTSASVLVSLHQGARARAGLDRPGVAR